MFEDEIRLLAELRNEAQELETRIRRLKVGLHRQIKDIKQKIPTQKEALVIKAIESAGGRIETQKEFIQTLIALASTESIMLTPKECRRTIDAAVTKQLVHKVKVKYKNANVYVKP